MNNKLHNFNDIRFIHEKIFWFMNKNPEDLILYAQSNEKDFFSDIRNQKGDIFICGYEAKQKFHEMANRYLKSHPERNKTNLAAFTLKIEEEFLRRFIEKAEEITDRNIDKMFATAHKSISREFEQLIHYIPCRIFFSTKITSFEIGSIKFLHKNKFNSDYGDEINRLRTEIKEEPRIFCTSTISNDFPAERTATDEQSHQLANILVDGLLTSFEYYDWIAIVNIHKCNEKVSYGKAIYATRTALNILRLLFGSYYTDEIRIGIDCGVFLESAKLTRKENGKLDINLSGASNGNVIGDEWLEHLKSDVLGDCFNSASKVLNLSLDFDHSYPLCTRFIDALSWYGDAVSERVYATKIVKYVTSIERLVGTGKETNKEVTQIVTQRASMLYSIGTVENESYSTIKTKISELYDCRSKLVHGSLSPFDESCISYSYKAEEISRMVLLVGLSYFSSWGIDDVSFNNKKLKNKYNDLEILLGPRVQ